MHPIIYAVDFDGTLQKENGEPNVPLIEFLLDKQKAGIKLILWTTREGELLDKAVRFCMIYGLRFDAVNKNIPEIIMEFGDTRKIYANLYIDDKSVKPNYFKGNKEKPLHGTVSPVKIAHRR